MQTGRLLYRKDSKQPSTTKAGEVSLASVCSGDNFRANPQSLPVLTSAPARQPSPPGRTYHTNERPKSAFLQVMTEILQKTPLSFPLQVVKETTPGEKCRIPATVCRIPPPFYKSRSAPISRTGYSTSSRPGVPHLDTQSQEKPLINRKSPCNPCFGSKPRRGLAPARTHNEDHTTSASAGAFFLPAV